MGISTNLRAGGRHASRKIRMPVPNRLGSLSRRDLDWVPEEGRGAPSESPRPGFQSLLAGEVEAAMAACLCPQWIWSSASLPGIPVPSFTALSCPLPTTISQCLITWLCIFSVAGRKGLPRSKILLAPCSGSLSGIVSSHLQQRQ